MLQGPEAISKVGSSCGEASGWAHWMPDAKASMIFSSTRLISPKSRNTCDRATATGKLR